MRMKNTTGAAVNTAAPLFSAGFVITIERRETTEGRR
jgi:hypothetical protein